MTDSGVPQFLQAIINAFYVFCIFIIRDPEFDEK